MMTTWYLLTLAAALIATMGLYALRLRNAGLQPVAAAVALPLSALLAVILGRVLYVLLQVNYVWRRWGMGAFIRPDATMYSFFGGLGGVLLGAVLASLLLKQPVRRSLDAFAPPLALAFTLGKAAEGFLGLYGTGSFVEPETLRFFPLAVRDALYDEWYYAVFMLAAALGAAVLAVSLLRGHRQSVLPGLLMLRTIFYLMMALILCESLRAECMKWGFVKCEQLLCAVVIAAETLVLCARTRVPHRRRWLPFLGLLAIVGGLIAVEFREKLHWAWFVAYPIMLALLALLAALEMAMVRRRRQHG